jgi:predicted anti-sigma-YlaC factor YlaD
MKNPSLVDLTCQAVTELITEFMQGEMSAEDRVNFEQHLHACTWCMTYLAQMRRTQKLTAQLATPEPAVDREALLSLYRDWQRKRP